MRELTETDVLLLRQLETIREHFTDLDYEFRALEANFIHLYSFNGTGLKDRQEFDHLIKGDLNEYRNPSSYPDEWKGTKVYRMTDWTGDFTEQFHPGDLVTVEIAEEFLDCVPPVSFSSTHVQCGEPYSHELNKDTGKYEPVYITFVAVKGSFNDESSVWQYRGLRFKGNLHS